MIPNFAVDFRLDPAPADHGKACCWWSATHGGLDCDAPATFRLTWKPAPELWTYFCEEHARFFHRQGAEGPGD